MWLHQSARIAWLISPSQQIRSLGPMRSIAAACRRFVRAAVQMRERCEPAVAAVPAFPCYHSDWPSVEEDLICARSARTSSVMAQRGLGAVWARCCPCLWHSDVDAAVQSNVYFASATSLDALVVFVARVLLSALALARPAAAAAAALLSHVQTSAQRAWATAAAHVKKAYVFVLESPTTG